MKKLTLVGAASLALFMTACESNDAKKESPRLGRNEEIPKGYIRVDSANKMIQSYLTSIAIDTPSGSAPELNSLIMNADLLRDYLSDPSIKEVKVMFAHTLSYINDGNQGKPASYRSDALTIIFAGYDRAGNYIFSREKMVPNHAMPCPRNCPDFGSASNNLLQ